MLLESLRPCVLKSNVILATITGQAENNVGLFRSRSNRHSLFLTCQSIVQVFAGNICVIDGNFVSVENLVLSWDNIGDMISRIDRIEITPGIADYNFIMETWNEERPEETP